MSTDVLEPPPESPIESAYRMAEQVAMYHAAFENALDELAKALSETDLEQLERQVRNSCERARPMARWLEALPSRITAREAP